MSSSQRQSRFERGEDVVVMKFGGTSVEDAAAIRRLIDIVEGRLGAKPVLIISALAKITDQLLEAGNAAAKGHLGSALATVRNIYVRHEELADSLLSASAYGSLDRELPFSCRCSDQPGQQAGSSSCHTRSAVRGRVCPGRRGLLYNPRACRCSKRAPGPIPSRSPRMRRVRS